MPELVELQKIYRSIKDGFAKREEFFEFAKVETQSEKAKDLTAELLGGGEPKEILND